MIRAALRLLRAVPARLELEYLRWAQREIHPQHPDVPYILRRIAALKDQS